MKTVWKDGEIRYMAPQEWDSEGLLSEWVETKGQPYVVWGAGATCTTIDERDERLWPSPRMIVSTMPDIGM